MLICVCLIPLLFSFKKLRTQPHLLFTLSILINIGMWLERFIIVTGPLAHGFDPFLWGAYHFEWVEIWITIGSFGWFFSWFLLFIRFFPAIAIAETKEAVTSLNQA